MRATLPFGEVVHVTHVVGEAPFFGSSTDWWNMPRFLFADYFDLVTRVAVCIVRDVIAGRADRVVYRQIPFNLVLNVSLRVFQGVVSQCAVVGGPVVIRLAV